MSCFSPNRYIMTSVLVVLATATTLLAESNSTTLHESVVIPTYMKLSQTSTRDIMCINGKWNYQIVPGPAYKHPPADKPLPPVIVADSPQANPKYTGVRVLPTRPKSVTRTTARKLWYTRKVSVPESWKHRRVILQFMGAGFEIAAYVNGTFVGSHIGDATGFEFDITGAVKPGQENQIRLRVWLHDARYGQHWPQGLIETIWTRRTDIWDDIYLVSRPQISVQNVFIKPSWRKKQLALDIGVTNKASQASSITAECSVETPEGTTVLDLSSPIKRVAPGKTQTLKIRKRWTAFKAWSPENPYLYTLVVRLKSNGTVLDEYREQFGFSESWIEGKQFYHNGVIRRYHCLTIHQFPGNVWWHNKEWAKSLMKYYKRMGYSMLRTFAKPNYVLLEAADEVGMFIKAQSGWHHGNDPLTKEFKKNSSRIIREWIQRDRNHPSIVMWDAANEPDGHYETVKWVMDEIRRNDPTRPIDVDRSYGVNLYNWAGKPKATDNYNPQHTRNSLTGFEIANPHYPLSAGRQRHTTLSAANYPASWMKYGKVPLFFGEWTPFSRTGDFVLGEDRYLELRKMRRFAWNRHNITPEGFLAYLESIYPYWRAMGVSGYDEWISESHQQWFFPPTAGNYPDCSPKPETGIQAVKWDSMDGPGRKYKTVPKHILHRLHPRYYPNVETVALHKHTKRYSNLFRPVYLFFPDRTCAVYGGRTLKRKLSIINDSPKSRKVQGRVELLIDGQVEQRKTFSRFVRQGKTATVAIPIKLPSVQTPTSATIRIIPELSADTAHAETLELEIHPRRRAKPVANSLVLYDPTGQTARALRRLNIPHRTLRDPRKLPAGSRTLLIGRNSVDAKLQKASAAICRFAKSGGKVVSLSQWPWKGFVPYKLRVYPRVLPLPQVWKVADHPAMKGISDSGLKYWPNDRGKELRIPGAVSSHPFVSRLKGPFRPILVAGSGSTLQTLISIPMGRGEVILSQMDIVPVVGESPAADLLLRNLCKPTVRRHDFRKLWFVGPRSNSGVLKEMGITPAVLSSANKDTFSAKDLIVWFPGDAPVSKQDIELTRKAIRQGAALLAISPSPKMCPPLSQLPEYGDAKKYKDEVYVMQMSGHRYVRGPKGRCVKMATVDRANTLADGVTNGSLFRSSMQSGTYKLADYEIEAAGGYVPLTSPGVIAAAKGPTGSPLIVVTAIRGTRTKNINRFDAMLHSLLVNLGVQFTETHKPVASRPTRGEFTPVNLRSLCTMGFRDDVSGDGKGGWGDQGPQNDLRDFPIHTKAFLKIPFSIIDPADNGGKSCVILGSSQIAGNKPRSVTIDFGNRKATRVHFLHSASWAPKAGRIGEYVVKYERALQKTVRIPLEVGTNIADWYNPLDVDDASVAWRGGNARANVGVYLYTWTNPYPDMVIEEIEFKATHKNAILGLIAVTVEQ